MFEPIILQSYDMEEILVEIRKFADKAHGEQMRRYSPERYIEHPLRVMSMCRQFTSDPVVLGAALLHDVLEDTPVTEKELHYFLRELMGEENARRTINIVIDLTDIYVKKDYPAWNRAKRRSKEFQRLSRTDGLIQSIKYADIIDNSRDVSRQDPDFAGVFLREYKALLLLMDKGDSRLRAEAITIVDKELAYLKDARR